MNAQIKKGILEMCILYMIKTEGPIYGYDLLKAMKLYFPEVNDSTFYAILRRLYKNNMTDIQYVGLQRKYYKINEEGRKMLAQKLLLRCSYCEMKDILDDYKGFMDHSEQNMKERPEEIIKALEQPWTVLAKNCAFTILLIVCGISLLVYTDQNFYLPLI